MAESTLRPYREAPFQRRVGSFLGGLLMAAAPVDLSAAEVANWTAGTTPGNYGEAANWDLDVIPINTVSQSFIIEVPANGKVSYDVAGTGKVDALRLGANATFTLAGTREFAVQGISVLDGPVTVTGAGAVFQSSQVNATLNARVRFSAADGGEISVLAATFELPEDWRAHAALMRADGADSQVVLRGLSSLTTRGGHGGAWDYSVTASNGGLLDLSGLTSATGPRTDAYSNDDWLTFRVLSGGQLKLDHLTQIARRTRLIPEQDWALPALEAAEMGFFLPAAGVTLELPEFLTMGGGQIILPENAVLNAPKLTAIQDTTLTVATNAAFHAGQVSDLSGSTVRLEAGGTLALGTVSQIDRASFLVRETPTLTPAATRYELPDAFNSSWTIFEADGAGVNLNFSTVNTLKTGGGWGRFDYFIRAQNGGHVDLSGLTEATGPRTDTFGNNDWLSFYLNSGGTIDLSSLRRISRKVRFLPEAGEPLNLPALEEVDGGQFKLLTGSKLDVPSLRSVDSSGFGAWIEVDFAAEVNAPVLGELVAVNVTIHPGGTLLAPELTNIINTSLVIASGGRLQAPRVNNLSGSALVLDPGEELLLGDIARFDRMHLIAKATPAFTFSATSYTTPDDWRTHRTPFEADGVGVHLALGSLETITVPGGRFNAFVTSVTARNGGSIDLSGLRAVQGGRTDANEANDWLTFRCETGGSMELGDVTVSRIARLQAAGSLSRMKAANLHLRAPARLEISEFGTLEIAENFDFNHTAEGQMPNDASVLAFTGPGEHRLEVGGQDAGSDGFAAGNFGFGRLEIGQPGTPATVRLVDAISNGNRGGAGEPEALYLYGVDTAGLVLHSGSRLIVGDLNVYVLHGGAMVHLNTLLGGGDTMDFGDGVVTRFGGPAIVAMSPSGQVPPVVDHVDVTFNTPINEATFTTADVTLSGSSGAIPVSFVSALGNNSYRIAFPGQSDHGFLTVRVGPNIEDATGQLSAMDQNGNGVTGDPDDAFETRLLVDTRGPAVAAAMVLRNSGLVGAIFDEDVESASFAEPANYAIGGSQPNAVAPRPDGRSVALRFPLITSDTFTLETVNLEDLLGNVLSQPQQAAGTVLPLSSLTVGAPTGVREAYTHDGATFEIKAGGGTVWSTADSFQFYQEPRTGDFDVKLRMASLSSPQWSARLGIMAREHAGNNSRHLSVAGYQPNLANRYEFHRRSAPGGNSDTWGATVSGITPPNAWLRLRRVGNDFRAFTSTDGAQWTQRAETAFELPETLLVGFFVSSEDWNLSRSATAIIADWGEYSPAILREPQDQTVFQSQTTRLAVEARGVGELSYQWRLDGNPIPGATAATLELANIQLAQAGDYHVVVQNAIASITSQTATVVVDTSDPGAGFEADLMPRNAGDGTVGVSDWTMVGRMAVGLEDPANASEFARADCAPRSTLGNGVIGVTDWVQAGRYVAGLEPPTAAGGPNGVSPLSIPRPTSTPSAARELALTSLPADAGQLRVAVQLRAFGNENSVGFSVGFDAAALEFTGVTAGHAAPGASLLRNTQAAAEGRVGVALALPAGARLLPGEAELAVLEFKRLAPEPAVLALAGSPVAIEAANAVAESLAVQTSAPDYRLENPNTGALSIVGGAAEGASVRLEFHGKPGARVLLEVSTDLTRWQPTGAPVKVDDDGTAWFTTEASGSRRFFRVRLAD